jgi:hypothetical protein
MFQTLLTNKKEGNLDYSMYTLPELGKVKLKINFVKAYNVEFFQRTRSRSLSSIVNSKLQYSSFSRQKIFCELPVQSTSTVQAEDASL